MIFNIIGLQISKSMTIDRFYSTKVYTVKPPPSVTCGGGSKRWTFSETVDNRAHVVTLPSVLSAVCITQNCILDMWI